MTRTELIARLRNGSNWLIQGYGDYKDCVSKYDRSPFEAADMLEADGEQVQCAYDEGVRRSERDFDERVRMHKEEARAYKEAYFKLIEQIVSGKAFEPPQPIVMQSDGKLREAARLALDALRQASQAATDVDLLCACECAIAKLEEALK